MTARIAGAGALICAGMLAFNLSKPSSTNDGEARIQHHLATVRSALGSVDIGHFDAERRAARVQLLEYLDQYRRRGVFPHNHVVGDRRTTVFIDEHGTHCAVGYLMARTGDGALARRIADTANLARVADLAADPELRDWLDRNGLSALEAAMIQPAYDPGRFDDRHDDGYDTATLLISAADIPLIIVNWPGSRSSRVAGGFGLAFGALQAGLGVVGSAADDDDLRNLSIGANLVLGGVGTVFGLRQLIGAEDDASAASSENREPGPSLSLSPWLSPDGGSGFRVGLRW